MDWETETTVLNPSPCAADAILIKLSAEISFFLPKLDILRNAYANTKEPREKHSAESNKVGKLSSLFQDVCKSYRSQSGVALEQWQTYGSMQKDKSPETSPCSRCLWIWTRMPQSVGWLIWASPCQQSSWTFASHKMQKLAVDGLNTCVWEKTLSNFQRKIAGIRNSNIG